MSTFELAKATFNALKKSEHALVYTAIWLFLTAILFWKQTMMAVILTGTDGERDDTRNWIVCIILVIPVLEYGVFGNYISKIVVHIKATETKKYLLEYNMLTQESHDKFSDQTLQRKLDGIEWGISYWIENGFPTFFHLISSLYLCVYTFYITNMMYVFFGLITVNGVLYKYVKQHLDKRQAKVWDDNNKKRDKNRALLDLALSQFAYGQQDIDSVMKIEKEKYFIKTHFDKTRNEQRLFTGILSQLCMAITLLLSPSSYIVSYLTVTIQFTGMMSSIFSVMNANTQFEYELKSLQKEFDKGTKKHDNPLQYTLNDGYQITRYALSKPKFSLEMKGILNVSVGNTVLIQGESGAGKTTFLKGIFGFCEDARVTMSNNLEPKNFQSSLALMYQSIKENIKIPNLTLRELFDGTTNVDLVEKVLDDACVGNWVERLKSKADYNNDYIIDIDKICQKNGDYVSVKIKYEKDNTESQKTSWMDIDLSEIGTLSGGEKTRLILARQLFEGITKDKKILVLDEPEQGTDPPVSYKMIKNIVDNFSSRAMIVIISHLERFGGFDNTPNTSGIHFSQRVFVKNGIVSVTNC